MCAIAKYHDLENYRKTFAFGFVSNLKSLIMGEFENDSCEMITFDQKVLQYCL
jgi:hypothetical protein